MAGKRLAVPSDQVTETMPPPSSTSMVAGGPATRVSIIEPRYPAAALPARSARRGGAAYRPVRRPATAAADSPQRDFFASCRNRALSRVMVQAAHDASPEPMTEDRDEIHADDLSQR